MIDDCREDARLKIGIPRESAILIACAVPPTCIAPGVGCVQTGVAQASSGNASCSSDSQIASLLIFLPCPALELDWISRK